MRIRPSSWSLKSFAAHCLLLFLGAIVSPSVYSSELTAASPNECSKFDRFIYTKTQCHECIKRSGNFVVPCIDSNCSGFGDPRCNITESTPTLCSEAKINVDWVIDRDPGAKQRYASFRGQGQSPVDAVISAQAHNPHAQDTIRRCRAWANKYLADLGLMSAGANTKPKRPFDKDVRSGEGNLNIKNCSSYIKNNWGTNNLSVAINNNCDVPIKYSICFKATDGWTKVSRNLTVPARNGGGIVEYAMHDVEGKPLERARPYVEICPITSADCPLPADCP